MTKTLLAVDGNSMLYRSFHALVGSGLTTSDGRPTWAIKGAVAQILHAVERISPDAIVVGFDDPAHSHRKQKWPHYKAQRHEKPAELISQVTLGIEVLSAMGLHVVVPDGWEADDVLCSASTQATAAGWRTVVMTSDRDAFALINDTTSMLRVIDGKKGPSPILTPADLRASLGIDPSQYREFAAMRGDTSDNLTGIHGIGEKTGVAILNAFGTVQAAFDDVDHNAGARVSAEVGKAAVKRLADLNSRAAFWTNMEIMSMRPDLPLGFDPAGGAGHLPLNAQQAVDALTSVEFASLTGLAYRLLTHGPDGQAGVSTMSTPDPGAAIVEEPITLF